MGFCGFFPHSHNLFGVLNLCGFFLYFTTGDPTYNGCYDCGNGFRDREVHGVMFLLLRLGDECEFSVGEAGGVESSGTDAVVEMKGI